ncbi:hypothetical protein [Kibdelosporangium philippinense]|uniref:hypothetical protein n=1 Tax=Kibdelosporangium philippinense TaxID=211113 RepID=UPI0036127C63
MGPRRPDLGKITTEDLSLLLACTRDNRGRPLPPRMSGAGNPAHRFAVDVQLNIPE